MLRNFPAGFSIRTKCSTLVLFGIAAPYLHCPGGNTAHLGSPFYDCGDWEPDSGPVWPFDNSYARLPDRFYARLAPTPVAAPKLVKLNSALALQLGLDPEFLASPEGVEILAGNRVAEGSEPIALAYAGHQFGNFVPQLGDGRAVLLGEVVDTTGVRRDIQLKG